jgi:hypothetical protein
VPYLTVGNTSSLALERAIAPDGTTITGTDGGANGSYGLSVTTNGIGNAQLRQGTATSVIGRSANSTGNVADIAASADGQFLQRSSAALTWAVPTATQITNTGAGNIAASTVQAAINELDTEKQPLDATLTAWGRLQYQRAPDPDLGGHVHRPDADRPGGGHHGLQWQRRLGQPDTRPRK